MTINFIRNYCGLSLDEYKKLEYFIKVLFNEFSKLIVVWLLFIFFNLNVSFHYTLLITLSFRIWTGGLHFNNYLSCLIFTIINFLTVAYFAELLTAGFLTCIAIVSSCCMIQIIIGPITSSVRPVLSQKKGKECKIITFFTGAFYIIFIFLNPSSTITNLIVLITLSHTIQLIIAKEIQNEKFNSNDSWVNNSNGSKTS